MALVFAYPFTLIRVLDGDTLEGYADLGFYIQRKVSVRVNGVNAPEVSGAAEKEVGLLVKSCVEKWFTALRAGPASPWLVSKEVDKYGRVLGEIEMRGAVVPPSTTLTSWLLTMKLVQPYAGDLKKPYTPQELAAIAAIAKDYLK
jgi:endonuclease YncB( thermonuclease family)